MNFSARPNYKDLDVFRKSFNELAGSTFGIDFEPWYKLGFWNNSYICYSYISEQTVVSNVSVSLLDVMMEGLRYKAVLIGTVMTHPDFRGRGLSQRLMNIVIDKYENTVDLIYLFANKNALNFYPQFGFRSAGEHSFSINSFTQTGRLLAVQKLNLTESGDLNLLKTIADNRLEVSRAFSVSQSQSILYWYCLNLFKDDIYFFPEVNCIAIYRIEGKVLTIYDIISQREAPIQAILNTIASDTVVEIVFGYTPDYSGFNYNILEFKADDTLFYKSKDLKLPEVFKYPITAQA